MRRLRGLWQKIVSMENLEEAWRNSRRGRTGRPDVMEFDIDHRKRLEEIRKSLIDHTWHSSTYDTFEVNERGKTRVVADLPYDPDRIVHWALMQVLAPLIAERLSPRTHACVPGRGVDSCLRQLDEGIRKCISEHGRAYFLQIDVRKFFPSIDKDRLMGKLRTLVKDPDVLWLCEGIVRGYPLSGIPIGNYTSQWFANWFLTGLDRHMTGRWHCRWYVRYMDDIVIVGWDKRFLHKMRAVISQWLEGNGLEMKGNWKVAPVSQGVDFLGYRTFADHRLLRRGTKVRMRRRLNRILEKARSGQDLDGHDRGCAASYRGILMRCDFRNLSRPLMSPLGPFLQIGARAGW